MSKKGRIEETCKRCGTKFVTWECRKKINQGKFCSRKCGHEFNKVNTPKEVKKERAAHLHKIGEKHPSWKGGRNHDKHGYLYVWVGQEHPHANSNGYIFEHRYVMEKHLNRYLKQNEIVHHKDGNKQNNNIDNLEVCENQKDHLAQHMSEKYNIPVMNYEWHPIFESCKECKGTDKRHQGKGLCSRCYLRSWKQRKKEE